jgi:hypothetical protein
MKKLIAISVMCALVVGAAFADTTFGGAIFVGGEFVSGDNNANESEDASVHSHLKTTSIDKDAYNTIIKVTFGDSEAGGWFSLHNNGGNANPYHWFGWWRPIPQLRLQIGRNTDGDFGVAQISGWGFTGEAKNAGKNGMGAINEYSGPVFGLAHARTTGWYQGTGDTPNFQISAFPIEGLTVNLWVPFNNSENAGFTYSRIEANVQYRIVDIGTATLSFQSNTGYLEGDPEKWYGEDGITDVSKSPKVYASFFLTAVENLAVDLGIGFKFPFSNPNYEYEFTTVDPNAGLGDKAETVEEKTTTQDTFHPFEIGLGLRYNMGDFQFKMRAGFSFGGSTTYDTDDIEDKKEPLQISFNINPNYKIGKLTVFFYAGLGIQVVEDWEKQPEGDSWNKSGSNAVVSWFINPYVMIPVGSIRFLTGVQIFSDGVGHPYYESGTIKYDSAKISWAIPFGFYTYF